MNVRWPIPFLYVIWRISDLWHYLRKNGEQRRGRLALLTFHAKLRTKEKQSSTPMFLRRKFLHGWLKKKKKKNQTLSVWTPSLPSLLLKSSFTSCQFTRRETDAVTPFPKIFTACMGYQEDRMINQIGFD